MATCAVLIVATAACGGDSRPTTPVSPTPLSPQPQIPNVAGTYQGPLTITAALAGGSLSGTMHITVVQAHSSQSRARRSSTRPAPPWTTPAASRPDAAPIPMGDDTCGTITPAPTMLTFSGTTGATSDDCGTVEIVGTLTRQ